MSKKQRKNSNYQTPKKIAEAEAAAAAQAEKEAQKAAEAKKRNNSDHKMWLRVLMLIAAIVMLLTFIMLPAFGGASAAKDGDAAVTSFKTGSLEAAITDALDGVDRNNVYRLSVSGGTLNSADYQAICNIPNLEYIELAGAQTENGVIPANALPARNQLTYISLPSNTEIISDSAFNNNKKLSKISMPDTVKEIGSYAFDSCIALTDISIPANLSKLGEGAFRDCQSLAAFTLPAGVTEIPSYCFSKCVFKEFYVGPQVTSIGDGAFADCHELKDIYFYGNTAPSLGGGGVFQNLNVTVHTPDDAEGFSGWNSNFVSSSEGFNDEYIPPETAAPPSETVSADEQSDNNAAEDSPAPDVEKTEENNDGGTPSDNSPAEKDSEPAAETEKETRSESPSAPENTPDEKSGGISLPAVIIIVVIAIAAAVGITLAVVNKKKF